MMTYPSRWLLTSSCLALCALPQGAAQAQDAPPQSATFFSARSGAWRDPGIWTLREGQDDDGLPDADDKVYVQAAHAVTFQGQDEQPSALELNLYGSLRLLHDDQRRPARLWAYRVLVRGGGGLYLVGPHTLTLTGGPQSLLAVKAGGALELRGTSDVDESRVTAVPQEDAQTLTLEDAAQRWSPGALRGHTLKLLDGRARLWSFLVLDNTATTVTLALGSLGSPPGRPPFDARPDPDDRRALWAAPSLLDLEANPLQDALWRGRWLRWTDRADQARWAWVYGVEDGLVGTLGDTQDRLLVWPPVPAGEAATVRFEPTFGVEPGDRYTLFEPARVTIPEDKQLPRRPSEPWGISVLVEARTRSAFVRASLGYGFLQLVRVDLTEPDTACEVDLLDIHDADPPCYLYAQEARGLRLRRLHARDVHPDSDLVAFGGRWEADQQRGHGFCLYGDDLWLEDSLATNLNDDLLYVSGAQGVTLKNNVALNSGVRHGNSLEGISLFDLSGPAVLEGNLSLGTPTPLRMERRSPQGTVTVRGGVLAQDRHQAMSLDQGPPDAGEVLFEDTVFLGGVEQPALLQASAPHRVERSLAARVQGRGPVSLRASAWLDPGRDERPALRDFAQVEGSLVSKPRLERGGALLYLQAPDASAEVLGSTLWPGEGGALRHASTSGRSTQVERNLSLGPLLTGNASDPKPAQPDVSLGWNRALGPLWTRQPWTAAHLADTNQSAPKLAWADPAAYLVAQDDPATTAAQGQPVGVVGPFGVSNPDALPLPLRPDLWTELLPLPPSEPPNLGNNNSGNNASSNNSAANNSGPKPSDDPKPDGGPKPDEEPPEEVVPRMTRPVGASCAACGRPAPRVAAPWWALALFWAWARLRAIKF